MDREEMNRLIPDSSEWNDGRGIDIKSWLSCMGTFELAIAFGELFWPELLMHDGGVYFADSFSEENYRDWMRHTHGDRTSVQAVINHVHVLDLFTPVETPPTRDQIVHVGRKLKEMWEVKFRRDFPDHEITVSFPEDDCDELLDYQVTFFIRTEEDRSQQ